MSRFTDHETLRQIIAHQNDAMKKQYFDSQGNRLWTGAQNFQALKDRAKREGGSLEELPRFNASDAIAYFDGKGEGEVWVDPNFSGYARAFGAMLRCLYNYDYSERELSGLNIDHIYSREAARNKLAFVRVAAIDSGVNQARGSHEKRLGPPLESKFLLARATVADYCKINNCHFLIGTKGMESAGIPMMVAYGVYEGFIPQERASQLMTRGIQEVKNAFR
ncbi:MAG TPA: hypothetical protein VHT51_11005 [Micropepsaceae bacterium]|nr:hypothetical protein [Micropepsaceae bacterium]